MNSLLKTTYIIALLIVATPVSAVTIERLPDVEERGDFVVGPTQVRLELAPGEQESFSIQIVNRLGKKATFTVSAEDISGSDDPDVYIKLHGADEGPYSVKGYLKVEQDKFTLSHGERIELPVVVDVPETAKLGGRYGSVVISLASDSVDKGPVAANVVTRVGVATLITVDNGSSTLEGSGYVKSFRVANNKKFVTGDDASLYVVYENTGEIHVTPQGSIEVQGMFGGTNVYGIEPWVVLPHSVRTRDVELDGLGSWGRYEARLSISHEYQSEPEELTIKFWVLPIKQILIVLIVIVVLIALVRSRFRRQDISKEI